MKDVTDGKTPNTWDVLNHVMDSVTMLGNINWKLNMKRRELIKPELNPPYTRLCEEDIAVSANGKWQITHANYFKCQWQIYLSFQ